MAEEQRPGGAPDEQGERESGETGEPTAPSIGAKTKIEHIPPEERLEGHEHSTEDAMGLDKRRAVKGETYGPTRTRVIMSFVVFFAIVAVVFVGLLFLVDRVDQPPDTVEAKAPWSASDAEQQVPTDIDARPDGAATALEQ
jgi:hypothetical protein